MHTNFVLPEKGQELHSLIGITGNKNSVTMALASAVTDSQNTVQTTREALTAL